MAISNIQETLLMYTKQKALLNEKLTNVMFTMTSATKKSAEEQARYNEELQTYYYEYYEEDPVAYSDLVEILNQDHEMELANLQSWKAELELQKNNYETKLNEITAFESSWTKLLQTNVKKDFAYGGQQQ